MTITRQEVRANREKWGDWKTHDGGPCPIPNAKAGEYCVRFRNRSERTASTPAIHFNANWQWNWRSHSPSDIIAYSVKESS